MMDLKDWIFARLLSKRKVYVREISRHEKRGGERERERDRERELVKGNCRN